MVRPVDPTRCIAAARRGVSFARGAALLAAGTALTPAALAAAPPAAAPAAAAADPAAQAERARLLGDARDRRAAVTALLALLESPHADVRAEAAAALTRHGRPAVAASLAALSTPDVEVDKMRIGKDGQTVPRRSDYLAWVLIHSSEDVAPALIEWAQRHRSQRERERAARSDRIVPGRDQTGLELSPLHLLIFILSERGSSSIPAADALLAHRDEMMKLAGLQILERIGAGSDATLARLQILVDGGSDSLREHAVYVASVLGPEAQPHLRQWLLRHPNATVRLNAARSLAHETESVRALIEAARNDAEEEVRDRAAQELLEYDELPLEVAPGLVALAEGGKGEARLHAIRALDGVRWQRPASEPAVAALLKLAGEEPAGGGDGFEEADELAARALAAMGELAREAYRPLLSITRRHASGPKPWKALPLVKAAFAVRAAGDPIDYDLLATLFERTDLNWRNDLYQLVEKIAEGGSAAPAARLLEADLAGGLAARARAEAASEDPPTQETLAEAEAEALQSHAPYLLDALLKVHPEAQTVLAKRFATAPPGSAARQSLCGGLDTTVSWAQQEEEKGGSGAAARRLQAERLWLSHCSTSGGDPAQKRYDPRQVASDLKAKLAEARAEAERETASGEESGTRWANGFSPEGSIVEQELKPILRGAANADEVLLAVLDDPQITPTRELIGLIAERAGSAPLRASLVERIPTLPLDYVDILVDLEDDSSVGQKPLLAPEERSNLATGLLDRLAEAGTPPQKGAAQRRARTLKALLGWAAPAWLEGGKPPEPLLRRLLASTDPGFRTEAARFLASHPTFAGLFVPELERQISSSDRRAAAAAGEALLTLGSEARSWDEAAAIVISNGIREDIGAYLQVAADEFRPSPLMSGPGQTLPRFPWPPPAYASKALFGADVSLSLLGKPSDTLGAVHRKLVRALARVDRNFDWGLFSVPGGFAMLTKLEQTHPNGVPAPHRWLPYRKPPTSLREYLVSLFLAPAGYYRALAFIFTDRSNFGHSNKPLPEVAAGEKRLPDDLAALKLGDRSAYVLVYAFQRRDTGVPKLFPAISPALHLERSGIAAALTR